MIDQSSQFVSIKLDPGIDQHMSEQSPATQLDAMVNFDFKREGDVVLRGAFERLASTANLNVAPGILLTTNATVPVSRRAAALPLEVECIARAATGARLLGVQAATVTTYTLVGMVCHDESATGTSNDDLNNFINFLVYDASGTVLATLKFDPSLPIADVKLTSASFSGAITSFFLSYMSPQANQLISRMVTYNSTTNVLAVGSPTTLVSSVDSANWASSVHAVESDSTGLSLVVFTTAGGTIRYVVVNALTGIPSGLVVDTAIVNTGYTEMASCHADGIITVVTGNGAVHDTIGIYSMNDTTLSGVSTHTQTFPTVTLSRRLAVVPDDTVGSTNVLAFVELFYGTNAVLCNATVGVLNTMGEMVNLRLADAGTWVSEADLTAATGQHRVPLIGLTSSEFVNTNFRSHVVARVFFDSVTNLPRLSAAAIVAHSDAGMTAGKVSTYPQTRPGPLPRYAFDGGPTVTLPVMVIVRTTADQTLAAEGGFDYFGRAVRLTNITANAHQHRGLAKLGPNTYVGGSVPSSWDGTNLSPLGFPLPPRTIKVVDNGVTASGLNAGTYAYKVRDFFEDKQGTIFDSPIMFFGSSQIANVSGHTPKITAYPYTLWSNMYTDESAARFGTEIFRNPDTQESGDTTYRKAYSLTHDQFANVALDIVDKRSAATIATNELLPDAVNGEITSGPLPALNYLWAHRSRLFGVDAFDNELIRFTTEYAAPTAPRWSDVLSVRVTNSGGPVLAGASLADKLIVFQENQICVMSGEGPDGVGNGTFSTPESLRGVGVRPGSQGAVVEVPTGVMFVHSTGIYQIGFDLSLNFVGQDLVQKVGGLAPISRGVYLPSRGQVWFLTDGSSSGALGEPDIIVWDVTKSRWTTFSSSLGPFSDAIEVQGTVYLMDGRGRLLKAHSGSSVADIDEAGAAVAADHYVILPKVRADNGHQIRLRKVHVSGASEDAAITVEVQVTTHNESRGLSTEDTVYTASFDLANQSSSFQLPVRAPTQRCHWAQCKVSLTNPVAGHTNDIVLSVLSYEISVLPGTGKVPTSKRPTVS